MSIINPSTIKCIAQCVDVPKLSDEAAKTLAPDVEYRLREVVQEALKFAKHAKRTKLTTEDINDALKLRNVEPLYGFGSRDPAKFLRVTTHPELVYVKDPELNYQQLIETPLPKLPREAGVAVHWLAVNGVQPEVPENATIEQPPAKRQRTLNAQASRARVAGQESLHAVAGPDSHAGLAAAATNAAAAAASAGASSATAGAVAGSSARLLPGQAVNPRAAAATASVQLQLPVRHAVSRELQVYFDKIVGLLVTPPSTDAAGAAATAAAFGGSGSTTARGFPGVTAAATGGAAADKHAALLRAAFASVSADPGLHPLVPYFTALIAEQVVQHLGELWLLDRLLQLARALLANPAVHLEPYLQQLLPAVVTCLVTRTLGAHPHEDHWALRRQAASLLAAIAARFSAPHHNLTPRLCKVLVQAFLDPSKQLTSKYGAIAGLQALGPQVVRTLLIPHLEPFMSTALFPAMASETAADSSGSSQQAARDNSSSGVAKQHQDMQEQRQQQRIDAWQVYGALLSATGSAMYDLLIGQLQGQLPANLLLARRGLSSVDWETEYTKTLLAVKRPLVVRLAVRSDGQGVDLQLQSQAAAGERTALSSDGAADRAPVQQATAAAAEHTDSMNGLEGPGARFEDGATDSSSKEPQRVQLRHLGGASAASRRLGGSSAARQQLKDQLVSVAQVLGESWKEDSDVNATLGALLHLFGEDLLPCLPLPEVAAVSL